jgi:hypothetical protein
MSNQKLTIILGPREVSKQEILRPPLIESAHKYNLESYSTDS